MLSFLNPAISLQVIDLGELLSHTCKATDRNAQVVPNRKNSATTYISVKEGKDTLL